MEKAVIAGVLSMDDLQSYLTGHGFDAADTAVIVDLTHLAVDKAQAKAAQASAAHGTAKARAISLADTARAVRLGLTPIDTYTAQLAAAGFDQADSDLMVGILRTEMQADAAKAATRASTAGAKTSKAATMAQLEQEVIHGVRPIADYTAELAQLGYSVGDQRDLTELLQLRVDQAAAAAAKRAAAGTALANRGISLTDAERAVKLGVVPITTYTSMLQTAGFTPEAITVLQATLLAEVAKAKKAQTAANKAGAALAVKGISLPELERAVIAGVRPIGDYSAMLEAQGYSAADNSTLTELVQLKVEQAQRAAAAHADAEGKATQKGISLAQEEAAIVAGDLPMSDYDALLTSLGYDAVDRAVLEQLLQAKIGAAAAKAAGKQPAPAGGTQPSQTSTG